jgi:hypothetical protein
VRRDEFVAGKLVATGDPEALSGVGREGGVAHLERPQDSLVDELGEWLAAGDFHTATGDGRAEAVFELLAGLELEGLL